MTAEVYYAKSGDMIYRMEDWERFGTADSPPRAIYIVMTYLKLAGVTDRGVYVTPAGRELWFIRGWLATLLQHLQLWWTIRYNI